MHLVLWYVLLVCHQYDVCENYVGSVYVGGYGGLSESGLCVFCKLCPVCFLVVGPVLSDILGHGCGILLVLFIFYHSWLHRYTFKELIDIRDGIKECNGFTKADISRFILNICTR